MIKIVLGIFVAATLITGLSSVGLVQSDVSGMWEITLDTQTGEQIWMATFEQDGTALEGEIDMNDGEGPLPLTGSLEGSMIKWGFIVPDLDGDMPINFSGEVQGAAMKGNEGSFVWYGTGVWTAAKQ